MIFCEPIFLYLDIDRDQLIINSLFVETFDWKYTDDSTKRYRTLSSTHDDHEILTTMELTLTGGTTLSDNLNYSQCEASREKNNSVAGNRLADATRQASALVARSQQHHSHDHSHSHNHGHWARPVLKLDASTILTSKEQVDQFKTNATFRLNILSNVVRGGPYALFIDLLTFLVSDGDKGKRNNAGGSTPLSIDNHAIRDADPLALAQMLDGYGADGHTLTHWCAKRGW